MISAAASNGMDSYCAVRHIALSIYGDANLSEVCMAMVTAYFDVSGKPKEDARAYAVAGFASSVSEWIEFSKEWKKVLLKYNLPELHMADMVNRRHKKKLSHISDEDYADIIARLFCLLKMHAFISIVRLIEGSDLAAIRASGVKPLVVAGADALIAVREWSTRRSRRKGRRQVLHDEAVVFDCGEEGKGALVDATPPGIPTPIFRDSEKVLPLQGADWLAWEMARLNMLHIRHRGHAGAKLVQVRGEVHAAIRHIPRDWKYYSAGVWKQIIAPSPLRALFSRKPRVSEP